MTSTQIILFVLASLFLAQGHADDSPISQMQTALERRVNEFTSNVQNRSNDFMDEVERQTLLARRLIQDRVYDSLRNVSDSLAGFDARGVNTSGCAYIVRDLGIELIRNPAQCLIVKLEQARNIVDTFRDIGQETRTTLRHATIGMSICSRDVVCSGAVVSKAMVKILLQSSRLAALATQTTVLLGTFQYSVGGCVIAALADSPTVVTIAGDQLAACISNSIDVTTPSTESVE